LHRPQWLQAPGPLPPDPLNARQEPTAPAAHPSIRSSDNVDGILHSAPIRILAYALVGGVFLAFSDFIMRSLALTGGHGGVEAMQVINREVFRWVFMALFLGMAAVSLIVAGYGAFGLSGPAGTLIMMAGLVYLIGCFGVTVFFNVPMNEALAGMEMSSGTTRDYWLQTYVPGGPSGTLSGPSPVPSPRRCFSSGFSG
jgi:uncharacterized membrane protein